MTFAECNSAWPAFCSEGGFDRQPIPLPRNDCRLLGPTHFHPLFHPDRVCQPEGLHSSYAICSHGESVWIDRVKYLSLPWRTASLLSSCVFWSQDLSRMLRWLYQRWISAAPRNKEILNQLVKVRCSFFEHNVVQCLLIISGLVRSLIFSQILATAKEETLQAQLEMLARKGAIKAALLVSRNLGGEAGPGARPGDRSLPRRFRLRATSAASPRADGGFALGSKSSWQTIHDHLWPKPLDKGGEIRAQPSSAKDPNVSCSHGKKHVRKCNKT